MYKIIEILKIILKKFRTSGGLSGAFIISSSVSLLVLETAGTFAEDGGFVVWAVVKSASSIGMLSRGGVVLSSSSSLCCPSCFPKKSNFHNKPSTYVMNNF